MLLVRLHSLSILLCTFNYAYSYFDNDWQDSIKFWSKTICVMRDIKTIHFYGVYKTSSVVLDFYQNLISAVNANCKMVFLLKECKLRENRYSRRNNYITMQSKNKQPTGTVEDFLKINPLGNITLDDGDHGIKSFSFKIGLIKSLNVIVADEDSFAEVFRRDDCLEWYPDYHFLFLIIEKETGTHNEYLSNAISNLRSLWQRRKIQNVLYSSPLLHLNESVVYTYHPFIKSATGKYGQTLAVHCKSEQTLMQFFSSLTYYRTKDFNQYTLNIGLFITSPTVLKEDKNHPVYKYSDGYGGTDGHILAIAAQALNFTAKVQFPIRDMFGFQMDNGTYTGLIGETAYNKVDMSFVSFFVKSYGIGNSVVDFSHYIGFDRVCVVVPRAQQIPNWIQIYLIFEPSVWLCLFFSINVIFFVWYYIRILAINRRKPVDIGKAFYEAFIVITGGAIEKLPNSPSERVLLTIILIASITLVGTFSGALYTSFTGEFYYKELDNLNDIDKSGLPITYLSHNLVDVFGAEGDGYTDPELWIRLRKKLVRMYGGLEDAAIFRNASALAREYYFPLIKHEYVDKNRVYTLHLARECPRSYFLSYLLPKHSILRDRINTFLGRLNQAGIPNLQRGNILSDLVVKRKKALNQTRYQHLENVMAFRLIDVQTSFYTLGIGLLCSIIIFLEEINWLRAWYFLLKRIEWRKIRYKDITCNYFRKNFCSSLLQKIKRRNCIV